MSASPLKSALTSLRASSVQPMAVDSLLPTAADSVQPTAVDSVLPTAVDSISLPTLGFIGAGRVARCLAAAWSEAGYRVTGVASRSPASAAQLAALTPHCEAYRDPQQVVDAAELIFITVPDDAIAATVGTLSFCARQAVVHCSGASEVSLLDSARHQGALIGGFHPLFLFSGAAADVARLRGASVTVEATDALKPRLTALVHALGCTPLEIPPGARMLYHASANYAASFILCGLREIVEIWGGFGINQADVLSAVRPMLEGTLTAARERGLSGALAGPVSRGDVAVVAEQLERLKHLGGDHATLYALMTRRAVTLARERGNPTPALDAIEALLVPLVPSGPLLPG
jgi:predicted short-subunit dehydrogenase-like oxidoreductase (DUF2520 family)